MKQPKSFTDLLPIALYDPDAIRGECLAAVLETEGFSVDRALGADDLVGAVGSRYFRTVVVVADLEDPDCVRFLDRLRRLTPASWLVVVNRQFDAVTLGNAHRHGIDAVLPAPVDPQELVRRLTALQLRARTTYS